MTDRFVVDTDVISFLFKNDTRAKLYEPYLNGRQPIISFMTVAELYRWAAEHNWGTKRIADLESKLRKFVVCSVDPQLCLIWARIMAEGRRKGRIVQCRDGWVAATALLYGIPLISHNAKHFTDIDGLNLITFG